MITAEPTPGCLYTVKVNSRSQFVAELKLKDNTFDFFWTFASKETFMFLEWVELTDTSKRTLPPCPAVAAKCLAGERVVFLATRDFGRWLPLLFEPLEEES